MMKDPMMNLNWREVIEPMSRSEKISYLQMCTNQSGIPGMVSLMEHSKKDMEEMKQEITKLQADA